MIDWSERAKSLGVDARTWTITGIPHRAMVAFSVVLVAHSICAVIFMTILLLSLFGFGK